MGTMFTLNQEGLMIKEKQKSYSFLHGLIIILCRKFHYSYEKNANIMLLTRVSTNTATE